MTTTYTPMIDAIADEVITDADYPPVIPAANERLRARAASLKKALTDISDHLAKTWLVDGELPNIDWEEHRMELARLHGTLNAEASFMVSTVEIWCDE